MSLVETVLVGTTDLKGYASSVEVFDGMYPTANRRGSNYVVPGRDGEIWVAKPKAAFPFSVGLVLLGQSSVDGSTPTTERERMAWVNENWDALLTLCNDTSAPLAITRRLSWPSGLTRNDTCSAELAGGIQPTLIGATGMRAILNFRNLDGAWTLGTPA